VVNRVFTQFGSVFIHDKAALVVPGRFESFLYALAKTDVFGLENVDLIVDGVFELWSDLAARNKPVLELDTALGFGRIHL